MNANRTEPSTTASKVILAFTGTVLSIRFREQPGRATRVVVHASDVAIYCRVRVDSRRVGACRGADCRVPDRLRRPPCRRTRSRGRLLGPGGRCSARRCLDAGGSPARDPAGTPALRRQPVDRRRGRARATWGRHSHPTRGERRPRRPADLQLARQPLQDLALQIGSIRWAPRERCPSGLRSATGNRVRAERCVAGSNPALSVLFRHAR